jgi:hypothetical protein
VVLAQPVFEQIVFAAHDAEKPLKRLRCSGLLCWGRRLSRAARSLPFPALRSLGQCRASRMYTRSSTSAER